MIARATQLMTMIFNVSGMNLVCSQSISVPHLVKLDFADKVDLDGGAFEKLMTGLPSLASLSLPGISLPRRISISCTAALKAPSDYLTSLSMVLDWEYYEADAMLGALTKVSFPNLGILDLRMMGTPYPHDKADKLAKGSGMRQLHTLNFEMVHSS
jgi:hypothetical protein